MTEPVIGFREWYMASSALADHAITAGRSKRLYDAHSYVDDPAVAEWMARQGEPLALPLIARSAARRERARMAWANRRPTHFSCGIGHQKPERKCSCGLYAWASIDGISKGHRGYVRGAVVAWGHLVIHGDRKLKQVEGFRAEWARPIALVQPTSHHAAAIARQVADRWGVPLVPYSKLVMVAREHGLLLPEWLDANS